MEQNEIAIINANMVQLIRETDPSTVLLTLLESKGILGDADTDKLQSISSRHEKNRELYSILKTRTGSFIGLVCALNGTNQTGIRDKLYYGIGGTDPENLNNDPKPFACPLDGCLTAKLANSNYDPIRFQVTPPSHLFTGRCEYLEQVRSIFSNNGTTEIICHSIVGMGGIGKTDLARKAVDQFIRQDGNSDFNVIWVNAETEQCLTSDFKSLAKDEKALGVDIMDAAGGEKDIQTIVKEVYTYFKNRRCIYVFDNAETQEYLTKLLPSSYSFLFGTSMCRLPTVLITSRDSEWSNNLNCSIVKLELFSEGEAILFVQKVLNLENGCPNPSNELLYVQQLIRKLEYLPLAIKQAAFYVAEQMKVDKNYGVKMYLEEWKQYCQKILDKRIVTEYKHTYIAWKTTIDKIAEDDTCGKVAVDVLRKLAFLALDGVDMELFQLNQWLDLPNLREAFALLLRYSMISTTSISSFRIHRLVQELTRADMRLNGIEENELDKAISMLMKRINSINISQLQSAWYHSKRYRRLTIKYSAVPTLVSCLLMAFKSLNFAIEFAKKELEFLYDALPDQNDLSILNLEAVYCNYTKALGRGDSGYDRLWKQVQEILNAGSASEWELSSVLWQFCLIDPERTIYPDAWSSLDSILCSVDAISCNEKWITRLYDYGMCLYGAFDFAASTVFFNKALMINDCIPSKKAKHKQQLEHWLKLTSLYTDPSNDSQGEISDLLESLCLLLYSVDVEQNNKLYLALQTACHLFYNFGETDAALSICRYYLFIETDPDGVSVNVPCTLNQMSILLCEQGKFQEAHDCSLEASSLIKNMQYNSKNILETEYRIHLAKALSGIGRREESQNMISEVLSVLVNHECRDLKLVPLIFMNLVAAEVLVINRENHLSQELVIRADRLLSMLPANVSMPFLSKRLRQIKQKIANKPLLQVTIQSIEDLDYILSASTTKCCIT